MATLKVLRTRINSVKSTQKITSAMKMVATSKYRRAQIQVKAARPYAERMGRMMHALAADGTDAGAPSMLVGNGKADTYLIVAVTADRGLAGAFNSNVARSVRNRTHELEAQGKKVKLLVIGRKGLDVLSREYNDRIAATFNFADQKQVGFPHAEAIGQRIIQMYHDGEFDICVLVFNRFISTFSQKVTELSLIPAGPGSDKEAESVGSYEIESTDGTLRDRLVRRNLMVQIYAAFLESNTGFYASQMTAMDNASRNASDMIKRLSQNYNRVRQANITNELIEIVAAAESMRR